MALLAKSSRFCDLVVCSGAHLDSMRLRILLGAGANVSAALLLVGCVVVGSDDSEDSPDPADYLEVVRPDVRMEVWTDDRLVQAGHMTCAALAENDGDRDRVYDAVLAQEATMSPDVAAAWRSDWTAILAGALTYLCPEYR